MRVAFILGVSKYTGAANPLPACESDVRLMETLLRALGKYDSVCVLDGSKSAAEVKEEFAQKVSEQQAHTIEEVFFYYTGHGQYDGSEFLYILSDYSPPRERQTTLSNTEVDGWLRSLKPDLAVKVIDACHSGISYIKEVNHDSLESQLAKSTGKFNKCYFMFSSSEQQNSWQDDKYSDFTKIFAEAAVSYTGSKLRYRSIADYVADAFSASKSQTPYFIVQADNTEVFADLTADIRKIISQELAIGTSPAPPAVSSSLAAAAKALAVEYIDKNEYEQFLDGFKQAVVGNLLDEELDELYDQTASFTSTEDVPDADDVGTWLVKNGKEYFGDAVQEVRQLSDEDIARNQATSASLTSFARKLLPSDYTFHDRWPTQSYTITTGFKLTSSQSYSTAVINARPKLSSIPRTDCYIVFVPSKRSVAMFTMCLRYRDTGWESSTVSSRTKWSTTVLPKSELSNIPAILKGIRQTFTNWTKDTVTAALGIQTVPVEAPKEKNAISAAITTQIEAVSANEEEPPKAKAK